jgi:hypothetical protein
MRALSPAIGAVGVAALLFVCGCTSTALKLSPTPIPVAPPTSVPSAVVPFSITTCGNDVISIAFGKKVLGFASCAGIYISTDKPPRIYMSPGQTIQVEGVSNNGGTISADNSGLLVVSGSTVTAKRIGSTEVRFVNLANGCFLSVGKQMPTQLPSVQCVAFVLVVR